MAAPPSDTPTDKPQRTGFFYKPPLEQAKLIALFALIALLVYYSQPTRSTFVIGTFLVLIGAAIRVWAAGHLRRDQQLTTSGPYAYSRNPFYLGRLFLLIGFAIMSGLGSDFSQVRNIILWLVVAVALIFFFVFYMPRKEQREGGRLAQMFGPDYELWKANVPSLFPRLTPFMMNPRPWSRDLFMGGDDRFTGNKELWTTLTTLLLIVAFYLRMETRL